eukprot:NODE_460_length_7198_cov_0.858290.p1 type:complete len:461 gc:universal NODE_460_length_7198_cov_0.858290:4957-3575(-)
MEAVEDFSINCLCGIKKDDGFTIQCERCLLWAHAKCYKINPAAVPEHFYCISCKDTSDDDTELIDEESFINWFERIVEEYKSGIYVGEKPKSLAVPLDNAAYLIHPKPKLKKAPILSHMKFKPYDRLGNELYLTLPGQTSWQEVMLAEKNYENHSIIYTTKTSSSPCFHSTDEIKIDSIPYFAPTTAAYNSEGLDLRKESYIFRKGCQGNLNLQKIEDKFSFFAIDKIKAKEELILQYTDKELENVANWTFQEFLSGCKPASKSGVILTCASCKYSEFRHCILYHKLLRNQKLDVVPVRGDQPALSVSPVEPNVKRKRGRPPKKKPTNSGAMEEPKRKKQSPKLHPYSRKGSNANSPIVAPRLNPASITPSQISEAEVDDLIPQIVVFEEPPISDLTYLQIGNGMVVKRSRLKSVKQMPAEWKAKPVQVHSLKRLEMLKQFKESKSASTTKILTISDFIK